MNLKSINKITKNLSRTAVLISTLLIIISLIGFNIYSVYNDGKDLNHKIKAYKEVILSEQGLLNEIINLNSKTKNILFLHFVTDDDKLMSVYENEYYNLVEEANQKFDKLEKILTGNHEKTLLYNLKRFRARYYSQREYFLKLSKQKLKYEAKSFYGHSLYYSFSLYRTQLENIKDHIDLSSTAYYDILKMNIEDSYNSIKRISLLGIIFVIILVLISIKTINKLNKNNLDLESLLENAEKSQHEIRLLNENLELKVKERTQELESAHNELSQQILVLNHAAIVSEADELGSIINVNNLFCEVSGYNKEDIIGKNYLFLTSDLQPKSILIELWETISSGKVWKGELHNKKLNNDNYWIDTTIMPFKNSKGEIVKYLSIGFEITKQKEQQRLLQDQADELSATSEELRVQQEELHEANTILAAQTSKLQSSEEILKRNQELLQERNNELSEKSKILEEKNIEINIKNIELKKIAQEIEKKAEELELSSKYKSEFLANMSHELRTPLNSILLLSKLLSDNYDGNLSPEQIEYCSVINSSGNGLLELINEILDLSKIESGKMDVHKEFIPVKHLCKIADNIFVPLAKNKGIEFISKIHTGVPESIFTDRIRVDQVLKNLVSNAIKFTEKGKVELDVFMLSSKDYSRATSDNPFIAFQVSDSGIGIPEDKLYHIFEAFQQADGSTRRKYGGTGLGLSISKEIAQLLDGEIIVSSKSGKGSVFTFIIPSSEFNESKQLNSIIINTESTSDSNAIENKEESEFKEHSKAFPVIPEVKSKEVYLSDKALEGKQILIVDDDNRNIFSLKTVLERQNIQVATASNGLEALSKIKKQNNFDLVLMDMMMPEMDGYETVKQLRKDEKWRKLPVIAITAKVMKGDKEKCIEAGVSDYLTKPIISDQLLALIKVWLYK